ncbi:MAG: hypothetical protein E4G74_00520 [Erysipelotrichales bacterium]|nr:MAG: hypothetical protein E4G74_00520 [Erysipelotrichales bacterium]
MFIVSFLVVFAYMTYMTGTAALTLCLLIAFVATLVEAISPWGLDNILVPMISALVYFIYVL